MKGATYPPTYAHFGTWKKPCYTKLGLVDSTLINYSTQILLVLVELVKHIPDVPLWEYRIA